MATEDDGQDESVEPILLKYSQACKKLGGISKSQLYRLMKQGEIKPLSLGPQVRRISITEIEAYVARLEAEQHGGRPAA